MKRLSWGLLFLFSALCFAGEFKVGGQAYFDLKSLMDQYRFPWKMVSGDHLETSSKWTDLSFKAKDRHCFINGTKIFLNRPIILRSRGLYIAKSDWENNIRPILDPKRSGTPTKLYRIILDPGHGGKDFGCQSKSFGLIEKRLTLDLAQRLKKQLENYGYKVTILRNTDQFLSLDQRIKLAKNNRAEMFISLHFNSAKQTSVSGIETFALTPLYEASTGRSKIVNADRVKTPGTIKNPWNTLLGYYIQSNLVKELKAKDRGLKRARFKVLKNQSCPSILVECGFLSNRGEASKIRMPHYRDQIAKAITNGVLAYQNKISEIRR